MATEALTVEPIIIDLNPEWFKPGYYVYIVRAHRDEQTFYYVGMTGDRKHLVARSPFYRMGGHFTLSESSTQNQIIKGLKTIAKVVDVVSELQSWNFKYYAYLVEDFNKDVSAEEHKRKREIAEYTEASLIDLLRGHKYTLFNKDVRLKTDDSAKKRAQEIFKNFQNQLK